jgi:hypothetical protein
VLDRLYHWQAFLVVDGCAGHTQREGLNDRVILDCLRYRHSVELSICVRYASNLNDWKVTLCSIASAFVRCFKLLFDELDRHIPLPVSSFSSLPVVIMLRD